MTANTYRSRKSKGKRLEKYIASLWRKLGVKAHPMPMSGGGYFKGDIQKETFTGWVDECKNQEKIQIWSAFRQAESQCSVSEKPVLHLCGNFRPHLTVIRTEDFFELLRLNKK